MSARAVVAAALLAAGAACGGNRAGHPDASADAPAEGTAEDSAVRAEAADSVRGVVAVVGADPLVTVTVRAPGGPVPVRGPVADTLRGLDGVEVRVDGGRRADGSLEATSFRVRSADGLPAADGVLELRGDTVVLTGAGGERARYAPAPAALRALEGRRVWIAGPPGGRPASWGVIGFPEPPAGPGRHP